MGVLCKPPTPGVFWGAIRFYPGEYFAERGIWRAQMPLTDLEVRKSRSAEKAYRLGDSKSLFLSVTPSGGKLWR